MHSAFSPLRKLRDVSRRFLDIAAQQVCDFSVLDGRIRRFPCRQSSSSF